MNPARPVRAFGVEELMTGTTRSSEGLDIRRRKLLFRSWHRGMREMDLIMGGFADSTVADLAETELADFEQLIEVPDRAILAWVTGEEAVPAEHDTPLFRRLRDFHLSRDRSR
jgi:antitoxin CptB